MAFLKNVAVRSNDKDFLLPRDEPVSDDAYVLWKNKNYSTALLAALNNMTEGYKHAYAGHNMYRFFKILKANGLLGSIAMARSPSSPSAIEVEGVFVYVDGEKIYVDSEGFEL